MLCRTEIIVAGDFPEKSEITIISGLIREKFFGIICKDKKRPEWYLYK